MEDAGTRMETAKRMRIRNENRNQVRYLRILRALGWSLRVMLLLGSIGLPLWCLGRLRFSMELD